MQQKGKKQIPIFNSGKFSKTVHVPYSYNRFHAHFDNRYISGAAEMLAMEMKASGMYVSRGLSFRQAEV